MSGNRFLTNASSNQRAYLNLFGCFWCTIWSFLMGFTWPNWKQEPLLPILFSLNTLKSWELSGLVAVTDENVLLVSQMQCYKSFTWLTHSSGPPEWGSFRGRRWLITPETGQLSGVYLSHTVLPRVFICNPSHTPLLWPLPLEILATGSKFLYHPLKTQWGCASH